MKATLEGLDQVKRSLAELPAAVRAEALAAALPPVGDAIAAAVRAAAPRRTGQMAADIASHVTQTGGSTAVVVRPDRRGFYALYVDGGTRHAAARPFVQSAADSAAPSAIAEAARAIQASIDRWWASRGGA